MPFLLYKQNNSGGPFKGPAVFVFFTVPEGVDSASQEQLDRAGIYFDGVSAGTDCPCCGDRWEDCPEVYTSVDEWRNGMEKYLPLYEGLSGDTPLVKIYT